MRISDWSSDVCSSDLGDVTDRAPITYFPVSLGYAGTLTRDGGELGFNTSLTFAFRGLGRDTSDSEYNRFRATGGFAFLKAADRTRVGKEKGVSELVDFVGRVIFKKKTNKIRKDKKYKN